MTPAIKLIRQVRETLEKHKGPGDQFRRTVGPQGRYRGCSPPLRYIWIEPAVAYRAYPFPERVLTGRGRPKRAALGLSDLKQCHSAAAHFPVLVDFFSATLAAATRRAPGQPRFLNGRAWDVGERTVDAAIASVRPEHRGTTLAVVEKLARIGRHRLSFDVSALRTGNRRFWFHRRRVSPPAHRVAIRAG